MTRDEAWEILTEHTKSESLLRHALAVEGAMRHFARMHGEDEEKWGNTGLLHDFDYEMYPQIPDHPLKGSEILEARGVPQDIRKAILGHAVHTGVPRDTLMAKVLFSVDELSGFISAVALVRPSKAVRDVKPKSVKKKFKDKSFAAKVNREEISTAMEELGVDPTEHIQSVIDAMCAVAGEIGLG